MDKTWNLEWNGTGIFHRPESISLERKITSLRAPCMGFSDLTMMVWKYLLASATFSMWLFIVPSSAFSLYMKEIYGIPRSGWTSPDWNWGSAVGTGHDCAAICRRQFGSCQSRASLVSYLLKGQGPPFEEVKLILALAWQRGRWDGCDGGLGGYGEVLNAMAQAQRYEVGDECDWLLVQDMKERYHLLDPNNVDQEVMMSLDGEDVDGARRRCSGLVL